MKGKLNQAPSFLQNAIWFVKLRWFVCGLTFAGIFIGQSFFKVLVPYRNLYFLALLLVIVNTVYYITTHRLIKNKRKFSLQNLRLFLNFQVATDLLILTAIIHYSGGIENPIIVFYIFHMILSAILLPRLDSFIESTFALFLFTGSITLEYHKIIPHYTINPHLSGLLESGINYLTAALIVFIVTSYVVVYLTSYVTNKLRSHELELEKLNIELNEKDRIKNEYVLRLTHDIKGFVSALKSNHEVIRRKIYGEINNKYTPFIEASNDVLSNLTIFIKDLLKLTRSKLSGEQKKEEIKISELLENVESEIKNFAQQKNIELIRNINTNHQKLNIYILSVKELLINVLNNAIKYSDPNSKVIINVSDYNLKFVLFKITDEGVGIPEKEIPKLFSEFYRASNIKSTHEGTGLGLAIVKQIAKNHGGKVWIDSKLNSGTSVYITLPV